MEKDEKDSGFNIVKKSEKKSYSLSIILPVFNVEKYLERCIKSILEGTYNDLELIIVNDGSKDNSDDIIRRYIEKYNNITWWAFTCKKCRIYVYKRRIYCIF